MLRRTRPSYAREKYRRLRRHFLRANARGLVMAGGIFAASAIPFIFLMHGYGRGFVHGVLLTNFVFAVTTSFHAVTGAHRTLSGAWGEDNTRGELKAAKRKRLIRGWVDNLETQAGDVDHLVIARSGELFALDSKWHSETDPISCGRDTEAARRAARTAQLILKSLGHDLPVKPVVVMWGGAQSDLPAPHLLVDGIDVVQGRELVSWLRATCALSDNRAPIRNLEKDLLGFRRRVQPGRAFA